MIGSHDSFTYLKATSKVVELFSRFWRCQDKTIKEQYDNGVRCFDVRVFGDTVNNKFIWRIAHGAAELLQTFISLTAVLSYFKTQYPESIVRIVLEKGDQSIVDKFKKQSETILKGKNKNLIWELVIKDNWEVIYHNDQYRCVDYSCHLFNWDTSKGVWENLKHINLSASSIKGYAKDHNPEITQEMIDDKDVIHFMDYAV